MELKQLTEKVMETAIKIHKKLGPGLSKYEYEGQIAQELSVSNISFKPQSLLPVVFNGISHDCGFKIDFLVEKKLILEIKNVDHLMNVHGAEILTYMKLANVEKGLLINFNEKNLKDGIKSFIL